MDLFKDNKEIFDNIIDLYYKFEGHRNEELQRELLKINDSMIKIEEILDDNYGI